MTVSSAHIFHHQGSRGASRGMDSKKAEDLARIRDENRVEAQARVEAGKAFARGMQVKTQDGRVGKVSSVNQRTGSIELTGKAFRRPEWHSATSLQKT